MWSPGPPHGPALLCSRQTCLCELGWAGPLWHPKEVGEGPEGRVEMGGLAKGKGWLLAVPRQQPPGQPGCFLHSFLGMNEAGTMPTEPGGVMSQVPKPDSIRHFDLPEPPKGNICCVGHLVEGECISPLARDGLRGVAFSLLISSFGWSVACLAIT